MPSTNIILNDERLKTFSIRSAVKQELQLSSFPFIIILKVLAQAIRQEKETKGIQIRKEVKLSVFTDDIKLYIESHKNRDIDQWNRLEGPDANSCIYSQLFTIKMTRIHNRKKNSFFH